MIREEYIFLALVILGPKSPGRDIDIFLQPLVDELNELWSKGVETFDCSRKQNFIMRVTLLWTVNDFPTYEMLSGWGTHGRLACPYCMGFTKAFCLDNGRKACWFDCHRVFLPLDHPFRFQKDKFIKNRRELDPPPPHFSGDEIWRNPPLTKKNIFWNLSYWSSNMLRHNLDAMHTEKKNFEFFFILPWIY